MAAGLPIGFLFTPMLHEIAASDLDITNIVNPLRKLLRRVKVFVGEVKRIGTAEQAGCGFTRSLQLRQPLPPAGL